MRKKKRRQKKLVLIHRFTPMRHGPVTCRAVWYGKPNEERVKFQYLGRWYADLVTLSKIVSEHLGEPPPTFEDLINYWSTNGGPIEEE